ncbi:MAG: hypothetical protein AAF485_11240 [Chloroflexota bacterium]
MTVNHVITHTHWDREWFLPADVVKDWTDELFDRLFALIDEVPAYRYVLDGQTLILDDYLTAHPEKLAEVQKYAQAGNLLLGPFYGQLDWRTVSEEALMRNVYIGMTDAKKYGNLLAYGWILDNFGYCAQSPQIHRLFGMENVFVWRGPVLPNDDIVSEFTWQGTDGSQVLAHFFVSGYRNFYNLTDTTPYIEQRIKQLKEMLTPVTPHGHLVFLDGYDTDAWPEDPFHFISEGVNGTGDEFIRSTPGMYVDAVKDFYDPETLPLIDGELFSGKYACVFPGTLSSRIYLRLENALVERILGYYLEPLQAIVGQAGVETDAVETEQMWRDLIKTQLHDDIGGVSVDQVHDDMEIAYRRIYDQAKAQINDHLQYIPALFDLQKGTYAFVPAPFDYKQIWLKGGDSLYQVSSTGAGFHKVEQERIVADQSQALETYTWQNSYYTIEITKEAILLNGKAVGQLMLDRDAGDTYNADPEPFTESPTITITSLQLLETHDEYARIQLERQVTHQDILVTTVEELFLSQSPLVEWTLSLDSRGNEYRLRFAYQTGNTTSDVFAKMPYDITQRPRRDANYFGRDIPKALRPILLAARELDGVSEFPFHGFVALSTNNKTQAVFAKGLREYEVDDDGTIFVPLNRSVSWLAKQNLRTRIGDAGPYMYVPSAKGERQTRIELALVDLAAPVDAPDFLKWYYLFESGGYIFENKDFEGTQASAVIWPEALPWSGVQNLPDGQCLIRTYNPFPSTYQFSTNQQGTNPFGETEEPVEQVEPNKIEHLQFAPPLANEATATSSDTTLLEFPMWPVGEDHSTIEQADLDSMQRLVDQLKEEQTEAKEQLPHLSEAEDPLTYHRTKHAIIRLEREILEGEVSILLNELRRQGHNPELKEKIRTVGRDLNMARRQRRTYDYILSIFENQ